MYGLIAGMQNKCEIIATEKVPKNINITKPYIDLY